jgi:transposase-like protein
VTGDSGIVTEDSGIAHEGLKAAVAKVLKTTWQRCRVHFIRNALAHANKSTAPIRSSV